MEPQPRSLFDTMASAGVRHAASLFNVHVNTGALLAFLSQHWGLTSATHDPKLDAALQPRPKQAAKLQLNEAYRWQRRYSPTEAGMSDVLPEIERTLLGSLLMTPTLLEQASSLSEDDFSNSWHARTFSCIREMAEHGLSIDANTVCFRLESTHQLGGAGGHEYVAGLLGGVVERPDLKDYVKILKEQGFRRQLQKILERAQNPASPFPACMADVEKLSARYRNELGAERKLQFKAAADFSAEECVEVAWIAHSWVAASAMTELSGKVKAAGKTTFMLSMVACVLDGRPFLGQPTTRTSVVYLTEQPVSSFREALKRAGLLNRKDLHLLFWSDAVGATWGELITAAVRKCREVKAKLLIIDTLAQFAQLAGDTENNAGDALAALQPLQQQALPNGISVVLVRHERKGGGEIGDSGRGSSAFAGAVDTLISLRRLEGNNRATLRKLQAVSRFAETPSELVVELTDAGYVARGQASDVAADEAEAALLNAMPDSEAEAMTLQQLVEAAAVSRTTAQKVIKCLIKKDVLSAGSGKRGDPLRYYSPEKVSARTASSNGPHETQGNNGDLLPKAHQVLDCASGAGSRQDHCPCCGRTEWWQLADGSLRCTNCHPNPAAPQPEDQASPSIGRAPAEVTESEIRL